MPVEINLDKACRSSSRMSGLMSRGLIGTLRQPECSLLADPDNTSVLSRQHLGAERRHPATKPAQPNPTLSPPSPPSLQTPSTPLAILQPSLTSHPPPRRPSTCSSSRVSGL
eukprot:2424237-Rhodomonas_salina.1